MLGSEFILSNYDRPAGPCLLNCASDLREHVACIGSDQPDRADDNYENDSQHHGILSDVLSFFV